MFEWHVELHPEKNIQQSYNHQLSSNNTDCIPTSLQTPQGDPVNQYSKKKEKENGKNKQILYQPTFDIPFGNISTSA